MALLVVSACVLIAGCTSPSGNVTQPTTPPTETMTGTPTSTVATETTSAAPTTGATSAATTATTTTTAASTATTSSAAPTGGQSVTVDLTAQNIAYDKSTITVPAGAQVTVNFDNKDIGIPHNFAVYQSSSAQNAIFKGDIITGPATTTYTFTAPSQPGTYYFRCDVHPTQMNGQFIIQ